MVTRTHNLTANDCLQKALLEHISLRHYDPLGVAIPYI